MADYPPTTVLYKHGSIPNKRPEGAIASAPPQLLRPDRRRSPASQPHPKRNLTVMFSTGVTRANHQHPATAAATLPQCDRIHTVDKGRQASRISRHSTPLTRRDSSTKRSHFARGVTGLDPVASHLH
jgi:hypothetical protein